MVVITVKCQTGVRRVVNMSEVRFGESAKGCTGGTCDENSYLIGEVRGTGIKIRDTQYGVIPGSTLTAGRIGAPWGGVTAF